MTNQISNHCKKHNLTATSKMSATPSTSSKKLRFSLRRTLLATFLACLLLNLQMHQTAASADYGDPEELQHNNGGGDEIYDPALLQQDVEANEQQHSDSGSMEQIELETDQPLGQERNVSTNQISMEENAQELENATREQINNMKESSFEYDSDDERAKDALLRSMRRFTTESVSPRNDANLHTTMIPDYVRKAKAEVFSATMATSASEEAAAVKEDVDASMSDYVEDEEMGSREYQHTKKVIVHDESDDIVPLAMKFYQTADDEDNNLNEQERSRQPVPMPQQQMLPAQQLEQSSHNNSEEEYYEDSRDESLEQFAKQHTTSGPPTHPPDAVTTAPYYNTIDLARAAIPGFPLPFGGTWTRTTTTLATPITITTTAPTTESTSTTTTPMSSNINSNTAAIATAPTPTTSRPAGNKQGKQINISRRKLLPHEQLRNYIEDAYIRMPLAVIVDPSTESLEKTKALWRDALRTNLNIKIVLVALNASGIPAAYSFNNTRQFLAGLNSIKENDGGNAFIGIVHASELVPYDSAVFISTATIPRHTELVQDAAITLLKKRIRLYLIWYGERSISENETQEAVGGILGEVAIRSGGEILHIVGSENSQELEGSTLTLVADAFHGSQEVDIPVDTTLSSLHVKIDSPMRMATLETPHGG